MAKKKRTLTDDEMLDELAAQQEEAAHKIPPGMSVKDAIEMQVAQTVAKFLGSLEETISTNLRKSVAKILGFEEEWSGKGWKIDHCNGRESRISTLLSVQTNRIVEEQINEIITPDLVRKTMESAEIRKAISKDFADSFTYQFKSRIRQAAENLASEAAGAFVKKVTPEIATMNLEQIDLSDPNMKPLAKALVEAAEKSGTPDVILKALKLDGLVEDGDQS